jgi:hypothetical protein
MYENVQLESYHLETYSEKPAKKITLSQFLAAYPESFFLLFFLKRIYIFIELILNLRLVIGFTQRMLMHKNINSASYVAPDASKIFFEINKHQPLSFINVYLKPCGKHT